MEILTEFSVEKNAGDAISEVKQKLFNKKGHEPNLLIVESSAQYNIDDIEKAIKKLATKTRVFGGTSCRGVMCNQGLINNNGYFLAVFAIYDDEGSYGVGSKKIGTSARLSAIDALHEALKNANRSGEMPYLILISSTSGYEEEVIEGIESVLGKNVPIFGGSNATNAPEGKSFLITSLGSHELGVAVCVFFTSTQLAYTVQNGFLPTEKSGIVTKVRDHQILKIDGERAAKVYANWSEGTIEDTLRNEEETILKTTMFPLGLKIGSISEIPYFNLAHPRRLLEDGSIELFAKITEGSQVYLMKGSKKNLIERASTVISTALELFSVKDEDIAGVLITYCGGNRLAVGDAIDDVIDSIKARLKGKPFLGSFSFGEQGEFIDGKNRHGNLMIWAIIFTTNYD